MPGTLRPGAKIWNPVKLKMMAGQKVVGGTLFSATDPETYCAMANAGYDFIWTEQQHSARDWKDVERMWAALPLSPRPCPACASPIPTSARNSMPWTPARWCWWCRPSAPMRKPSRRATGPIFRRWASAAWAAARPSACTPMSPAVIAQTINDNLVLILMIETLDGLKDADRIAKIPGVTAIFAASADLGNFAGTKQGDPDYEREINIVHDAAIKAGVRLVRSSGLARPAGLHLLPGRHRTGGDRQRRQGRVGQSRQHPGQARSGPLGGTLGDPPSVPIR